MLRYLNRGRAADPGRRQAWLDLEDSLRSTRDSARRPWQERLGAALDAADPAAARAVLAEAEAALAPDPWPRTQLDRVEQMEGALETARRIAAADRAEAAGQAAEALRQLQRARDAGAPGLDRRIDHLRSQAAAAQHAEQVAAVDRALADPSVHALKAWLDLPPSDRSTLTGHHGWLRWLAGDLPRALTRQPDHLLAVALALESTRADAPLHAASLIAPHRAVVEALPAAAARLAAIDAAEDAARARERSDGLAAAQTALEAGDLDGAAALLAAVGGDPQLERALASEQAGRALERALVDAEPWTRVRMLRAEAQRTGSPRWASRAWLATQAARHATDHWSFRGGHGRRVVAQALVDGVPRPHVWSGHTYLVSGVGDAVELIEVRRADSVVTRSATLGVRTFDDPSLAVHGDSAWIGIEGQLIQVDLPTFQAMAVHRLARKVRSAGPLIATASWIWWKPQSDERQWVPVDPGTGAVEWTRDVPYPLYQIPGIDGLVTKRRKRATQCDDRLAPVRDLGLSAIGLAGFAFARGPEGHTLVLGARTHPPADKVELWRLDPTGGEPDRLGEWPIAAEGALGLLACDGERIFVASERPGWSRLATYRLADGALELLWETPFDLRQAGVVQDLSGGPVWVVLQSATGPSLTRLGSEAPPPFDYHLTDRPLAIDTEAHGRVVADAFALADRMEADGEDPASLGVSDDDLIEALCYTDLPLTEAQRLRAKTVPRLRVALAERHFLHKNWDAATRLLDGLPLGQVQDGHIIVQQHVVALALAGRLDDAVARAGASDFPTDPDSQVLRVAVERGLEPEPDSVHALAQAALDTAADAPPRRRCPRPERSAGGASGCGVPRHPRPGRAADRCPAAARPVDHAPVQARAEPARPHPVAPGMVPGEDRDGPTDPEGRRGRAAHRSPPAHAGAPCGAVRRHAHGAPGRGLGCGAGGRRAGLPGGGAAGEPRSGGQGGCVVPGGVRGGCSDGAGCRAGGGGGDHRRVGGAEVERARRVTGPRP
ncbi:MAG: hypothetical protein ACI8PZ_007005 [Myxococcota bacterium]